MARTKKFRRTENKDGTYTHEKLTAKGYVEISEDEWRRYCKTFVDNGAWKKRPADDGADDSQRLKRTKSVVPDTAKPSAGKEKIDSFVKRLENWVENQIQDMKTKRGGGSKKRPADDGGSNKRPADDGADDSQRLKRTKSVVPETVKHFVKRKESWVDMIPKCDDVDLTNITFGFLVDGDGAKDLSPEELKERLKLLEDYTKKVTAQSLILYQQNDTLKKDLAKVTAIQEKVTSNNNCVVELQGHIKKIQSTVEHLEKSNKEIIGGLQEAYEERVIEEREAFYEQIAESFNEQIVELKKENEQLKERLKSQEL